MASISSNSTQHVVDHGDPNVICRTSWSSILVFYLVNYLAHCATVKPYPGEPTFEISFAVIFALFFPSSGAIRAFDSINRRTRLSKTSELQRAAKVGALCMVVRSKKWKPRPGDHIIGTKVAVGDEISENKMILGCPSWHHESLRTYLPEQSLIDRGCKIHGIYSLPRGYELDYVPSDVKLHKYSAKTEVCIALASTYNPAKTVIAILQAIYSGFTLFRTRGDQIRVYGYASFGLTVIPYLLMSLMNLLGQLVTPDYPTLFLVDSPEMSEAKSRGGIFEGVVGSLILPDRSNDIEEWSVEAAFTAELAMDHSDGPGLPQTHKTSSSQHEELNSISNHSTSLVLRDKTPGSVDARPLRLDLTKTSKKTCLEEAFGYKVLIPRCSPYRCSSLSKDPEKLDSYSCSEYPKDRYDDRYDDRGRIGMWCLPISLFSLLVNGAFSHFQTGASSQAQRAWVISWLVVGTVFGCMCSSLTFTGYTLVKGIIAARRNGFLLFFSFYCVCSCLVLGIFFVPAVGGLVVVGQMLLKYGNCERI